MKLNFNIRGIALALAVAAGQSPAQPAAAGNEANFVLYSHRTEPAGEIEIKTFNDLSRGVADLRPYAAQLLEIEYAWIDKLITALYFETQKTDGRDFKPGGWRGEVRYRPFEYGTFLNPVLYVEYEHLREDHRYRLAVVGRKDRPEPEVSPSTEREVELRMILGHDIGRGFDIAVNGVAETNLRDGHWEFGYAAGLNYTLFRAATSPPSTRSPLEMPAAATADPFAITRIKFGAEMFGGLGDSTLGLTASSAVTEQYAGANLQFAFGNGAMLTAGLAKGLTRESEHTLVRLSLGYEIKP